MLRAVTFKNFKSYQTEARLPLAPLTVLMGANASGKSNAIEGLRFLSWLAQGHKLSSMPYMSNSQDRIIRGRPCDLFCNQADDFTLECETDNVSGYNTLKLTIVCCDGGLHIKEETITRDDKMTWLYRTKTPSSGGNTNLKISYDNFTQGGNPDITCNDQSPIFTQLTSPAWFNGYEKAAATIPEVAQGFEKMLSSFLFLDPEPARMRDYSFPADKRLQNDGSNISGILFRMTETGDEETRRAQRNDILSFVESLPEQNITGLAFLQEDRGGKMLALTEKFGDVERIYDATLLSDGTLRVLAIAAAVLSAEKGSLVVIEEIDNGVHPSRAKHLVEKIHEVAKRRGLCVLLSTHNPAFLDALPNEAVPDVVCCYRDPKDGASRLIRLDDIEDIPLLVAQGSLGYVSTSGILERFLKDRPTPEERRARDLAWLERYGRGTDAE